MKGAEVTAFSSSDIAEILMWSEKLMIKPQAD